MSCVMVCMVVLDAILVTNTSRVHVIDDAGPRAVTVTCLTLESENKPCLQYTLVDLVQPERLVELPDGDLHV